MLYQTHKLREAGNVTLDTYMIEDHPELSGMPKRPAVLIFPGGGYQMLSERESQPIAFAFLKEGYQACILHYTLKQPVIDQPLLDAQHALRMMKEHHEEWNIDPDKIIVAGFSAGGHLAASLCVMSEEKPAAMILGYPVISSAMAALCGVSVPSLDTLVDHNTPPAFLFTTQDDNVVPSDDAFHFALALQKAHVPMEFHFYQHGEHGISLATPASANAKCAFDNAHVATWFPLCIEWLTDLLQPFPTSIACKDLHVEWEPTSCNIHTALEVLLANPRAHAYIASTFPALMKESILPAIRGKNIYLMATMLGLSVEQLADIDQKLHSL